MAEQKSHSQKAFRGGIWAAGLSYFSNFTGLITGLILARMLAKEDFGIFAFSVALAEIIIVLTGMSFAVAAIKHQDMEDAFETACSLSFIQAIGIIFLSLSVGIGLYFYLDEDIAFIFMLLGSSMALQVPANLYGATLEKEFKFKQDALVRSSVRIISCLVCLYLAYSGSGPWSLVLREVLFAILLLLILYIMVGFHIKFKINKKSAKTLIKTSLKLLKLRISEVFSMKIPHLTIGNFSGNSFLGSVERSQYLASIPHIVLTPFTSKVAFPYFAKVKSTDRISKGISLILYISTRLLLPLVILSLFYSEKIIIVALGSEWLSAAPYYRALIIYMLLLPVLEVYKQALIARGQENEATWANIITIVVYMLIALMVYMKIVTPINLVWGISISLSIGFIYMFWKSMQKNIKVKGINLKGLVYETLGLTFIMLGCSYYNFNLFGALVLLLVVCILFLFILEKQLLSTLKDLYIK